MNMIDAFFLGDATRERESLVAGRESNVLIQLFYGQVKTKFSIKFTKFYFRKTCEHIIDCCHKENDW